MSLMNTIEWIFYQIPRPAQIAFLICVIIDIIFEASNGLVTKGLSGSEDDFTALLVMLTICQLIAVGFCALIGSLVFTNAIRADCFEEFARNYFEIRPMKVASIDERQKAWQEIADRMNLYIHTRPDVGGYGNRRMRHFNFTVHWLEEWMNTIVIVAGTRKISGTLDEDESLTPRQRVEFRLKQFHTGDTESIYVDLFEHADALYSKRKESI